MTIQSPARTILLSTLLVASLGLGAALASPAHAQEREDEGHRFATPMRVSLELHAGFTWWGEGFAAGARVGIPFAYGWLSHSIVHVFSLTVGADFYFQREEQDPVYSPAFGIPITLEWRFHFGPRWAVFAEVGVNVYLGHAWLFDSRFEYPGAWFVGAIGAAFYFTPSFSIVARAGAPYCTLGIAFGF